MQEELTLRIKSFLGVLRDVKTLLISEIHPQLLHSRSQADGNRTDMVRWST
jgi:hypothetical protein